MHKMKTIFSRLFILCGVCFIVAAIYVLVQNISIEMQAKNYTSNIVEQIKQEQEDTIQTDETQTYIEGSCYSGILQIPALGLELAVDSDWSYDKLKNTPCTYSEEPFIIAAHNYSVHFGKLKNLEAGDQVIFTDLANNTTYYEVIEIEYIYETQIEKLVADSKWDLTLFTCDYDNNVQRVVVRLMIMD